ncbi:LLM class flavin-dependent oxidoreductase [uncultured Phenylobacterium sp.]|uniref:LLM class flavin-dependent oxidoreductase n=1 Tax=uncultured Phenylobacterium sp. TaxID=349273 RepID=UPI0025CF8357|nr:LLM class flavin-dependent oxidoreductase [uncultured Phenylobacterium sp.]
MARMKFGAFLAPHHPIGEHPMLQMRNDIKFGAHLDALGFDEFWVGEHHSTGWEVIASPELLLAAVGERTENIRLGTGVVSLPYHHPFTIAQRMVQLDHQTRGRVIFGTGPGALPSDAHMLGIDPMTQRDRQDEAIGVIRRLFAGERVTQKSDWFTLQDARLQLFPLQEEMPMVAASSVSPSGMTLAGKYGMGVLSIGSNSNAGLAALPTQWGFAEQAAAKSGKAIDRKDWRVLMSWHIAETREEARAQAGQGLMHWHNEYTVGTLMRPGAPVFKSPDEAVDLTAFADGAAAVIGTPDDLIAAIRKLHDSAGGFGVVLGFVHDWANRENTNRSWELVARYVIPEIQGLLEGYRTSRQYVVEHRDVFTRAGEAVLSKIMSHEGAAAALKEGMQAGSVSLNSPNAPDLNKAAEAMKAGK